MGVGVGHLGWVGTEDAVVVVVGFAGGVGGVLVGCWWGRGVRGSGGVGMGARGMGIPE